MSVDFGDILQKYVEERNRMMKTDPRVRYTRSIIQTSFLELLRQRPEENITVREICEKAEINRSTFYKHYRDCCDLMDHMKEDILKQHDEMLAGMKAQGVQTTLTAILEMLRDNAALFRALRRSGGEHGFANQLAGHCFRFMDLHISIDPTLGWSESQKEMAYSFLVGGTSGIIEYWLRSDCMGSPEQAAASIMELSEIMAVGLSGKQP